MRKNYLYKLMVSCMLTSFSYLMLTAQRSSDNDLKNLIRKSAAKLGVSAQDINEALVTNNFLDEKTGIHYIYLQQAHQKIRVHNQIITVLLKGREVVHSTGSFIKDLPAKAAGKAKSIEARKAVDYAAGHLKLRAPDVRLITNSEASDRRVIFTPGGISRTNIETELVWVPNEEGTEVSLCWNVNINVLNAPDWWNVRIDAQTGRFVNKDNWTVHEHLGEADDFHYTTATERTESPVKMEKKTTAALFSPAITNGSYTVYKFPLESPLHGGYSNENEPWLKAGSGNPATTYGWHYDGTINYLTSQGNNVHAYEDRNAANVPGNYASSTTGIPTATFNFVPDFLQPPSAPTNERAAVTNLFYWNNIIHDVLYQYGFVEAAGNFQQDNLGRGGAGADYVRAEAQDGGGFNNANFATPPDGFRPRMQMFLWSGKLNTTINSPAAIAGPLTAVESNFSPNNKLKNVGPITGQVVRYNDGDGNNLGCVAPSNAADLAGKIALISRGTCAFTIKVKNAQNAGAIAVIMVNNVPGAPITMGGSDPTITIPAIMISQANGANIEAQLANNVNITMSGTQDLDGDFDNGIIVHEYGHGVSNRLTGGPSNSSCLSNAEQAGEGWSDYLALMLTTDWANTQLTDGTKPRPIGTYALGQTTTGSGIRAFPYTTDMTVNPLTYQNMATNGAVHFIGTIWCSALWDMTWNIIEQEGKVTSDLFNSTDEGGNAIALRLVMEGMKIQPCQPGFISSRDAIIMADQLLYGGRHYCAIWKAFARRGMGASASQGLSTSTNDQTVAFDYPCIDITCPSTVNVNTDPNLCSASVDLTGANGATATGNPTPTISYQVNGQTISSPYVFPAGTTTVTAIATNALATNSCTFDVVVTDAQAPTITGASVSPSTLWQPNHKMREVTVSYNAADNCGVTTSLSVTSSEPENGTGDGDTGPDWQVVNNHKVKLRAERDPKQNGRTYTIIIKAEDAQGNVTTQPVTVFVPKSAAGISRVNPDGGVEEDFSVRMKSNPTRSEFSLLVNSTNTEERITMQVFDQAGRLLLTRTVASSQEVRFGAKLRAGTYIVKLQQGAQRKELKLMKLAD